MPNELIINVRDHETRVALLEDGVVMEIFIERKAAQEVLGNIYRGRVSRVLPGMQAAFVDIDLERTAFLYAGDIPREIPRAEQAMFPTSESEGDPDDMAPVFPCAHYTKENHTKIEDLLQEGQAIMVQISKEPLGEKGARLTGHLSIPGRHLVLMPTVDHVGVSRLIEDKEKKERLKNLVNEMRPANMGFIVRTVSEDVSKETLKTEMVFLLKLWDRIQEKMVKHTTTGVIYRDLQITLRVVRDLFTGQVSRLVVDSYKEYENILEFINHVAPELKYSVEYYEGRHPIFDFFGVEKEMSRALAPNVALKSGAHIVIERTEALSSIDVNTGGYVGEKDLEETILKTNLEAVKEIARQLRLRSIGGIIVIDFISMEKRRNWETVYAALKNALANDKAKTHVLPMSDLGLIEMTRKRTRPSLSRMLTEPCMYCMGKGRLKSKQEICYQLMRDIEKESIFSDENGEIIVAVNAAIGEVLKGEALPSWMSLEKRLKKRITIVPKEEFHLEHYKVYI